MNKLIRWLLPGILLLFISQPAWADSHNAFEETLARYDLYSGELKLKDIDFSLVALIETKEMAVDCFRWCYDMGVEQMPLRLADNFSLEEVNEIYASNYWNQVYINWNSKNEQLILLSFDRIPGERMAEAYASGDLTGLTERERMAVELASAYFQEVYPWDADEVTRERSIFDFINESCTYWTDDGTYPGEYEGFRSAVGVLLDGKANCMGYSDAFLMLGRMAGFEVHLLSGEYDGGGHRWNVIQIGGQWYFVDATIDYSLKTVAERYLFFNSSQQLLSLTHSWEEEALFIPVAVSADENFSFNSPAFPELVHIPDDDTLEPIRDMIQAYESPFTLYILCDTLTQPADETIYKIIEGLQDINSDILLWPVEISAGQFGEACLFSVEFERISMTEALKR